MAKEKTGPSNKQNPNGELRRRWGALWKAGAFTKVGAQGLRMALWIFYRAKFSTCEVEISARDVARQMGVGHTTVHRGIAELVAEGVIELVRGGGAGRKSVYVVANRTPVRNTTVPYVGTTRTPVRNTSFHTQEQTVPPLGTNRTPVGNKPYPQLEHTDNISIGNSIITNGYINADTAVAGLGPATPYRTHRRLRDDSGDGPPAHEASAADT